MIITCFFGLIIGGIYSNAGYNQSSIQNRTGLLFLICLNQAFNGTIGVLNSFPKEKIIVNRLGLSASVSFVFPHLLMQPLSFYQQLSSSNFLHPSCTFLILIITFIDTEKDLTERTTHSATSQQNLLLSFH